MVVRKQRALRVILVLGLVAVAGVQPSGVGDAYAQTMREQFADFKKDRKAKFKSFQEEYEAYADIVREERSKYLGKVNEKWDDPALSSEKVWVEYSDELDERHSVDFENKTVTIEVVAPEKGEVETNALRQRLTGLVSKTADAAFASDEVAQAIERRSVEELDSVETAEVPPVPVLLSYLTGQAESAMKYVTGIVDHMMENMEKTTEVNSKGETVVKMKVPLTVPDGLIASVDVPTAEKEGSVNRTAPSGLPNEARGVWDQVVRYSSDAKVEKALVYAVIQTESAFDPMATSHIPAYGLMQIVPGSAGLDVTKELFGKQRILAPSYLYVPQKNIQAGATYLGILYHSYLKRIKDPKSRLYCAIAAYNTGAGNVAKAFTGKMNIGRAAVQINELTSQQVYDRLLKDLQYDEAKDYLKRVSQRMLKFEGMGV